MVSAPSAILGDFSNKFTSPYKVVTSLRIDNLIFVLYYRVNNWFLFLASILLGARQYFGDPIDCEVDGVDRTIVDGICWFDGTWTVPELMFKGDKDIAYPGIGQFDDKRGHTKRWHTYYQWVPIFLLISAAAFYFPHMMWKVFLGDEIKWLTINNTKKRRLIIEEDEDKGKRNHVTWIRTVAEHVIDTHHAQKAIVFTAMEVLNVLIIFAVSDVADQLLGSGFWTLGYDFFMHENLEVGPAGPLEQIFPRRSMCMYRNYGTSGDPQKIHAVCNMPLNVLYDKIFLVLWFMFVIELVLSGLIFVYRGVIFGWRGLRAIKLMNLKKTTNIHRCGKFVANRLDYSQFFLLELIKSNIDSRSYCQLVAYLGLYLHHNDYQHLCPDHVYRPMEINKIVGKFPKGVDLEKLDDYVNEHHYQPLDFWIDYFNDLLKDYWEEKKEKKKEDDKKEEKKDDKKEEKKDKKEKKNKDIKMDDKKYNAIVSWYKYLNEQRALAQEKFNEYV